MTFSTSAVAVCCWSDSRSSFSSRLRYFCSPQHTDSALYPIIRQMERAAGFTQDDNTQAKLDKLDALALTLNRLGEREIAAMIDRVTGNKALP
jgi:hypothetical protein